MLQLNPFEFLPWAWGMRCGRILIYAAFGSTAGLILETLLSSFGLVSIKADNMMGYVTMLLIVIVVASVTAMMIAALTKKMNLMQRIDELIVEGQDIFARLTYYCDKDIDRYEDRIRAWDMAIEAATANTPFRNRWHSSILLERYEDERQFDGIANRKHLAIQGNDVYMKLQRLERIAERPRG